MVLSTSALRGVPSCLFFNLSGEVLGLVAPFSQGELDIQCRLSFFHGLRHVMAHEGDSALHGKSQAATCILHASFVACIDSLS